MISLNRIKQAYQNTIWYNLLGFQATWLSLVVFQDTALPLALLLIISHIALSEHKHSELRCLVLIAIPGATIDSILAHAGLYQFNTPLVVFGIPVWLWLLWAAFSCTINFSLHWLVTRKKMFLIAGPPAAATSYYSAMHLGAVSFPLETALTIVTVATYWVLMSLWIALLANPSRTVATDRGTWL